MNHYVILYDTIFLSKGGVCYMIKTVVPKENKDTINSILDDNDFTVTADRTRYFQKEGEKPELDTIIHKPGLIEKRNCLVVNKMFHDLKKGKWLYDDFYIPWAEERGLSVEDKNSLIDFALEFLFYLLREDAGSGHERDENGNTIQIMDGDRMTERIDAIYSDSFYYSFDVPIEEDLEIEERRRLCYSDERKLKYPIIYTLQFVDVNYALQIILPSFYFSLAYSESNDEETNNPNYYTWHLG